MAYTIDLADAARRHQQAAECLHECEPSCRRRDVAGYLYGLAAECALKQIFLLSYRGSPPESKKEDPLYAHFPDRLLDTYYSRTFGELVDYVEDLLGAGEDDAQE
jgi:hypothetical protein